MHFISQLWIVEGEVIGYLLYSKQDNVLWVQGSSIILFLIKLMHDVWPTMLFFHIVCIILYDQKILKGLTFTSIIFYFLFLNTLYLEIKRELENRHTEINTTIKSKEERERNQLHWQGSDTLSIFLSVYLSVYLSVFLFVYLHI